MATRSYIHTVHNAFLLTIVAFTVLSGVMLATSSYQHYLVDSQEIRDTSIESSQASLQQKVRNITSLANAKLSNIENQLKEDIFYRVQEAVDVAYNVYSSNLAEKDPETVKALIQGVLNGMRYNQEKGYYFIENFKEKKLLLYPPDPTLEGKSFSSLEEKWGPVSDRFTQLINTYGDGFHSYMWPKHDDPDNLHLKISFVKRFDPFDWFIGTGLYHDDYLEIIREEIVKDTKILNSQDSSYMLLDDDQGIVVGGNGEKSSDLKPYVPEAFTQNNGRLYYAERIPKLGLVIGASADLSYINRRVDEELSAYKTTLVKQLVSIAALTLILGSLFFWLIKRGSGLIKINFAIFSKTFEQSANSNQTIPLDDMKFSEMEELCRTANLMIEENKVIKDGLEDLVEERTSELKFAQEKLLTQERLATLGQITATVSHELRNPLGAISNALFNIETAISKNDLSMADKSVKLSERSLDRCVRIIEELLDYGRTKNITLQQLDINKLIEEILEESTWPDDIDLVKEYASEVGLQGDGDMLRRAILNLLTNAQQAFQEDATEKRIHITTRASGDTVEIIIEDNGPGVPTELQNKIFEPLFSTKNFGVGLGMTVVKDIVTKHHGEIELQTPDRGGCRFVICLPVGKTSKADQD